VISPRLGVGILCLVLGAVSCSRSDGMWRDQFVFVGDDGEVLALGIHRAATGSAEAKGWLGIDGAWRSVFYDSFSVAPDDAADLQSVLSSWSSSRGAAARASLTHLGADQTDGVTLNLRTRTTALRLEAEEMRPLGSASDPEGVSQYRAGRALLHTGAEAHPGWLISEATPEDEPRRAFVGYGDFVFLVAASANGGPIVLKHSRQMGDYDTLLTRAGANAATASLETRIESDHLRVLAPQANIQLAFEIRDRDATSGVAPDGSPVRYETLLLVGAEASGVAFAITPVPENESGSEAQ